MNSRKVNVAGKVFSVNYSGSVFDQDGNEVDFPVHYGFKRKSIRIGDKVITVYLHKLMGHVWLGNEDVYHVDGNKLNNDAGNLRVNDRRRQTKINSKNSKRNRARAGV